MMGLASVLRALALRPKLIKLGLHGFRLGRDEARLFRKALCSIPSLQSLDLAGNDLEPAYLRVLAPALYYNTSIKVLDVSANTLKDMESAELLRSILHRIKTITTLNLSSNIFGQTTGAVGLHCGRAG